MSLLRTSLLAILFLSCYCVYAAPPPIARPLHIVASASHSIAIVTIGSAVVDFDSSTAKYEIEVQMHLKGEVEQRCLTGPTGLKVGRQYLLFLEKVTDSACGPLQISGLGGEPAAFEIENLGKDGDFVRLEPRHIVTPNFNDSIEVKQILEVDDQQLEKTLGTVVPLSTFLEYLGR